VIDVDTVQEIQAHVDDVLAQADPWLNLCPSCDVGLLKTCTCPTGDYRSVMLAMAYEISRLRTFVQVPA
jgi:hypothetical protein